MSITTNVPYGFELDAMPLEAFGGVGGHRMKPIPGLLRMHGLQLHGGRARKVVGAVVVIAAAVAIPFAVPAVIAAVGASTAVAAAAVGVATGAVIGASAGAASAAISGGNIGRGALIGGATGAIGGGISGYAAGPVAATGATGAPLGTVASAQAAAPAAATAPTVASGAGLGGSNIASTSQIAGQVAAGGPSAGLALPGAPGIGTALSGGATGAGIGGTGIQSVMATAPTAATFGGTAATGLGPTTAAAASGQLATAPIAGTQAAASDPGFLSRLGTGVSNVGSEIAGRFTDPANIADITLRAAGQLAGSAVAGDGLSAEQQQLVDMEMAQLRDLQQSNQQAFNDRLEAATALLGESRYFDPEYFGLQRAREQQIAGGQAKRENTRGLTGEQRRAESRRFDIDTGRNVGTAFDQGYLTGVQGRLQTQQAGLNAMPMPNQYTTDFGATSARLRANEEQRLRAADFTGEGSMFSGLFRSPA